MIQLTKEERKAHDKVMEHAPIRQLLMVVIWDWFYPAKIRKFHECVMNGMHWDAAYTTAKTFKSSDEV